MQIKEPIPDHSPKDFVQPLYKVGTEVVYPYPYSNEPRVIPDTLPGTLINDTVVQLSPATIRSYEYSKILKDYQYILRFDSGGQMQVTGDSLNEYNKKVTV